MYKKTLGVCLLSLTFCCAAASADDMDATYDSPAYTSNFNPGIYLGGQLGYSGLHYGPGYGNPATDVDNYKFAGRAYIGYSFSEFISVEFGYDYYGRPKFKNPNGNTQEITQQGLDIVAKATLPLDYGFGFYIKGGLAWINRSALHSNSINFASHDSSDRITPVGGLGAMYWFAPDMALDISWTKTAKVCNLPTTDLFLLGLIYKLNI